MARSTETISLTIIVLLIVCAIVTPHDPLALHQLLEVEVGGEEVISLLGYDLDGDQTTATITSLPTTGKLYHLSHVFNKHGYDPKKGKPILTVPTTVISSQNRVLYLRPPFPTDRETLQKWDSFQYTVTENDRYYYSSSSSEEKIARPSHEGTVTLIGPGHVLAGSDFGSGTEGWKVYTADNVNRRILDTTYEAGSKGVEMNHYVYSSDDSVNVDGGGLLNDEKDDGDKDLWTFVAPAEKFGGWHGVWYGGTFEFTLSHFGGRFEEGNYNTGRVKLPDISNNNKFMRNLPLVEIHCAKCALDTGVTIAYPLSSTDKGGFDGRTQKFVLKMTETGGWLKDPENVLSVWHPPTKCEFIEILSGISEVKIMGDFTKWYESVSMDNVVWRSDEEVKGRRQLPPCAQNKPDGRKCTC